MKDVKSIDCECGHSKEKHTWTLPSSGEVASRSNCCDCKCKEFKQKSIKTVPKECGKEITYKFCTSFCGEGLISGKKLLCPDCKKLNEQRSKR